MLKPALVAMPFLFVGIFWPRITNYTNNTLVSSGFVIRNINVRGTSFFDKSDVIKSLGLKFGQPIFSADLNSSLAKILLDLPWVKDAKIERIYPSSISVKVVERKPIGYFQQRSKLFLIDDEGTIIDSKKKLPGAIIFVGNGANKKAAELIRLLKKHKISGVSSASYIGNRRWNLEITDSLTVKLPESDMEKALVDFKKLVEEKQILEKDISVIDFRIPSKILVKEARLKLKYNEI